MYPIKQYRVKVYCPIRETEEEVFFHETTSGEKYYAVFDGCDHQYSDCEACDSCRKLAYQNLVNPLSPRT